MRFTNRNKHIIIIRSKFYLINYNVLALYEIKYLYNFILNNSKIKYADVSVNSIEEIILIINSPDFFIIIMIKDFKKTSFAMLFLMFQLSRHLF